jgi:hypothetical protein
VILTVAGTLSAVGAPTAHAICQHPPCIPIAPPPAFLTITPSTITAGQEVHFAVSWTPPAAGHPLFYSWEFEGDGKYDDASVRTPTWTFSQGVHGVGVKVCVHPVISVFSCGRASATVLVAPAQGPACPRAKPFDLLYEQTMNGWPLNPEWEWQCTYPGYAIGTGGNPIYPDIRRICPTRSDLHR